MECITMVECLICCETLSHEEMLFCPYNHAICTSCIPHLQRQRCPFCFTCFHELTNWRGESVARHCSNLSFGCRYIHIPISSEHTCSFELISLLSPNQEYVLWTILQIVIATPPDQCIIVHWTSDQEQDRQELERLLFFRPELWERMLPSTDFRQRVIEVIRDILWYFIKPYLFVTFHQINSYSTRYNTLILLFEFSYILYLLRDAGCTFSHLLQLHHNQLTHILTSQHEPPRVWKRVSPVPPARQTLPPELETTHDQKTSESPATPE